jgi:L-cysteine S-thiosulfotransferase
MTRSPAIGAAALALGAAVLAVGATAQERPIPRDKVQSGAAFLAPDQRALQQDAFANPGMLWVERGERLWREPPGAGGRSCASCHGDAAASMKGVAARYPVFDAKTGRLVNLEGRINECRTAHQGATPFPYESESLLSLAAYVAHQSRGMPLTVAIDGPARRHFEAGEKLYYQRRGQLNLACAQCHTENWGRKLGPETISQGHPNAYPLYRLEWQTLGSLQRRFRSCLSGVRAEMLPYGAPEYLDLELYVAWRAAGLEIETPGVRR